MRWMPRWSNEASRRRANAPARSSWPGTSRVNDRPVNKAGTAVAEDARIEVAEPDHPYVSRGGVEAGARARRVR